ncbi:hypothetical protein MUK42_34600 [Musa troglodytarum]|uniref:Uncharacterized protein n=1 Tax=Musa troglodytarum TaxID=320322 RepID=A0A9E7EB96_9LILI|nr:hypothetical protein MUK42_34600 [Musa troglodytarum]
MNSTHVVSIPRHNRWQLDLSDWNDAVRVRLLHRSVETKRNPHFVSGSEPGCNLIFSSPFQLRVTGLQLSS